MGTRFVFKSDSKDVRNHDRAFQIGRGQEQKNSGLIFRGKKSSRMKTFLGGLSPYASVNNFGIFSSRSFAPRFTNCGSHRGASNGSGINPELIWV